ncbi:hypothetical protein [Caballeronia sp. BR00000012568055]|uniref:hypothetical protein n=1 Tax=Caballeronia sp. BR00000012568055 TaxID=2918761 RepID=UPI0023FA1160|nr:hypothetical protein [Caballeronia sp. BR00000012568055]
MSTKLEFESPEGRLSLSIADAQFMAYDAGEACLRSPRRLIERMRAMGLGDLAEHHARLLAQNKVTVMELREARDDAEALLACGEPFVDTISPRLDVLRDLITRTQIDMRESVDRLAALSASCHRALSQLPGYQPPSFPQ